MSDCRAAAWLTGGGGLVVLSDVSCRDVNVGDDVVGVDEVWSVTIVICCCWREFSLFFLDIFVATL